MARLAVKRLSNTTLGDAVGAEVPDYDRSAPPTIVHLGVGAFARAHIAVYADDLLRAGHPATIHGVSLRSARAEQDLGPQDGWFTVTTREPSTPPATRLVGSVTAVQTGPDAAVDAIAKPATSLVTLTVTEKGYELAGPASAPAVIATALDRRRQCSGDPLVVASLDNLLDNGEVLRRQVLCAAGSFGNELVEWISTNVRFPRSVVDRMVPSTTEHDREEIAARLGVTDLAAVATEAYRSWVLEAVDGIPPLHEVGVDVVPDIEPYQRRKLWLLNGPHSAFAYGGLLAGHETIAAATADPTVATFIRGLIADVLAVVPDDGTAPAAFAESSLRRFANPALGHTCAQVAADGSRKLAQRLLPVMELGREHGLPTARLAIVVAAWLAAVTATPVAGRTLPLIEDPAAEELRTALHEHGARGAVAAALGGDHRHHADEVVDALQRVVRDGVRALEDLG